MMEGKGGGSSWRTALFDAESSFRGVVKGCQCRVYDGCLLHVCMQYVITR
ncbi:unnamed protein product [Periconia digitata]|uniref:Uncharacterized protein n=1 Tax=Periconia digitata TaxID=1303443 RepID=A0A9W4XKK7_9PLEO|nr:unnamed protein product [Periconia digitata]